MEEEDAEDAGTSKLDEAPARSMPPPLVTTPTHIAPLDQKDIAGDEEYPDEDEDGPSIIDEGTDPAPMEAELDKGGDDELGSDRSGEALSGTSTAVPDSAQTSSA